MSPEKTIAESYKLKMGWFKRLLTRYRFWKYSRPGYAFYLCQYGYTYYLVYAKRVAGDGTQPSAQYLIFWSETGALTRGELHKTYSYQNREVMFEVTKEDIL